MKVSACDTLLAIKALGVAEGMIESDRRVGIALIEHFNRDTGRCDPSLGRLARLLGLSVRTVIRSIGRLVKAGFFEKARHGGRSSRNSYAPVWSRFADLDAAWNTKFRSDSRARTSEMSPSFRRPRHLASDSRVNQTCLPKHLHHETSAGRPRKENGRIPQIAFTYETERKRKTSSSDAARTEAERRWNAALQKRFGHLVTTFGEIIDKTTEEIQVAATNAEMQRRGGGLAYIVRRLGLGDDPFPADSSGELKPRPLPSTSAAAEPPASED